MLVIRLMTDDSFHLAKEALAVLAVEVNYSWKVPCAYFLIEGLNGAEHANLIKLFIQQLPFV